MHYTHARLLLGDVMDHLCECGWSVLGRIHPWFNHSVCTPRYVGVICKDCSDNRSITLLFNQWGRESLLHAIQTLYGVALFSKEYKRGGGDEMTVAKRWRRCPYGDRLTVAYVALNNNSHLFTLNSGSVGSYWMIWIRTYWTTRTSMHDEITIPNDCRTIKQGDDIRVGRMLQYND